MTRALAFAGASGLGLVGHLMDPVALVASLAVLVLVVLRESL